MAAIDSLAEVAGRASLAEAAARSVTWLEGPEVDAALGRADRALGLDRIALARPGVSAVPPAPVWRDRLTAMVAVGRDDHDDAPADPLLAAARSESDAEAAVAVAWLSLLEAQRAVLRARAAAVRVGDLPEAGAAPRGYRTLPARHAAARYGGAVGTAAGGELSTVVRRRPRAILIKLGISLGIGLAYLGFLLLVNWESKAPVLPYLAPYALSGVIGGVVCTNALSWDAARVRAELVGGQRLWVVMVSKNVSMFLLAGAVGLVLCVGLAWIAGDTGALVSSIAELVTMMLVWLGIGNVLSVWLPLRVEPVKARLHDGTFKPFLLSFAISYVVGLGVNLMLTWKFWAKQSMITELGGIWVPVLMLTLSALFSWLMLTVFALSLADLPKARRKLLRELVDYKSASAASTSGAPAPAGDAEAPPER